MPAAISAAVAGGHRLSAPCGAIRGL